MICRDGYLVLQMPFLLLDLLHWSRQFIESHLMGASLCSVLDDCLKKSFLFCSIKVLVYQL